MHFADLCSEMFIIAKGIVGCRGVLLKAHSYGLHGYGCSRVVVKAHGYGLHGYGCSRVVVEAYSHGLHSYGCSAGRHIVMAYIDMGGRGQGIPKTMHARVHAARVIASVRDTCVCACEWRSTAQSQVVCANGGRP